MSFSRKVFLGGVPWDSTSDDLICTFSQFGNVTVLWPQKDGGYASHHHHEGSNDRSMTPKGYCYLLFEHESCVAELLQRCDDSNGGVFFRLSSPKFKAKDVQVCCIHLFCKAITSRLSAYKAEDVRISHTAYHNDKTTTRAVFKDPFRGLLWNDNWPPACTLINHSP